VLTLVLLRCHEHSLIGFGNILELIRFKGTVLFYLALVVHLYKEVERIKLPSLGFLVLIFKELQLCLLWIEHREL